MKLDIELDILKDIDKIEKFLDVSGISKFDSEGNKYSLFIRLGFLVKKFEHKIWNLNDEMKTLKSIVKDLKKNIKLLKKGS